MPTKEYVLTDAEDWRTDFKAPCNVDTSHYQPSCDFGPEEYITDLHKLVADCLWHDIDKRPELLDLRDRIRAGLVRLEGLYSDRIRKWKRKPNDALEILTSDGNDYPYERYSIGKKYRPKRKHPRIDLDDNSEEHLKYGSIVAKWDSMDPKPTVSSQDNLTDRMEGNLLDVVDTYEFSDEWEKKAWEWSVKHLISCLRKHTSDQPGCFVLTHQEIAEQKGMTRDDSESLDAFGLDIKHEILNHLVSQDSIRTDLEVAADPTLVAFLENVIEWAFFLVSKCREGNEVFEPRGPGQEMQAMSELHRGFFDWIFMTPSGAFVKNGFSGQVDNQSSMSS